MKFQASGFSVDVADGVRDASSYVFLFPHLGELPPNLTMRFEAGEGVDMSSRCEQVRATIRESYPDPVFAVEDPVRTRGDWQYFTHVFEFGPEGARLRMKELHVRILQPSPTVYIFTGVDKPESFARFEPHFDAMIRSFQPNEIQRIN